MKTLTIGYLNIQRTRILLCVIIPALLPLGGIALFQWLPTAVLKYFFFSKGIVAWTFTEYCAHRWAFHGRPNKSSRDRDMFNHTYHHTHPADMIITPFVRLLCAAVLIAAAWGLVAGSVWVAYPLGWLSGLASYLFMHYFLHQPAAVKYVPSLVKQHIWHHCKYHDKCFGVVSTFWDRVFKTQPAHFRELPEKMVRFYYSHHQLGEPYIEMIKHRLAAKSWTVVKLIGKAA